MALPLLLAALVTSCCSTWKSQKSSARDLLEAREDGKKPPSKMRLHLVAGRSVVVYEPAIREDSLVGLVDSTRVIAVESSWDGPNAARRIAEKRPSSIPLDSIRTVDLREKSTGKTLAVWGGALLVWSAIALATSGSTEWGY